MVRERKAIYLTDEELKTIICEESLYHAEFGKENEEFDKAMKKLSKEATARNLWSNE